jgi:tRNA modification GTPase
MNDTIAAVSTPVGEGGIGIVRLSGPGALGIADRIFVSRDGGRPSEFGTFTVHYGCIACPDKAGMKGRGGRGTRGKENNGPGGRGGRRWPGVAPGRRVIDEVLLTVMRAPKSYTKEDIVEINCHGGPQAVRAVLGLVLMGGARMAEPGEFTKRAFLNGRLDLSQAEAVLDVIRAGTESSMKVALDQLEGGLSSRVEEIRQTALEMATHVEASIDFPDEDIEPAGKRALSGLCAKAVRSLGCLIASYDQGSVLREGVLAIICGKPNTGKSSLMNILLKRDRVIVSPIPGTTRDAVEETINLRGIPVRLVDTAGISETADALEREGIARSRRYLDRADIVLLVLDASGPVDDRDRAVAKMVAGKKTVTVLNKCDLKMRIDPKEASSLSAGGKPVAVSVRKGRNIGALEKAIADAVWSGGCVQGEGAVVSNARHKELLDKALVGMLSVKKALRAGLSPELIAVDLREAIRDLGLITGRSVSDDLLERIFERFCVGK